MLQEKDAIAALARLEAGYKGADGVAVLFAPVRAAVTDYFKPHDEKLAAAIQYTLHQFALDIMNRTTVYEHNELLPAPPQNFSDGYTDVTKLFTGGGVFIELSKISVEDFNKGYQELDPLGQLPPKSNTYLTKWAQQLKAARANELSALAGIASFCESGSYNTGLAMMFEELGGIISSIGKAEMAKKIYRDRGYLDVIRTFELDVHIPTCIKEGHG